MCTALREAGIQTSDWAKHLQVEIQLQISPGEFFEGWHTYAEASQPSWVNLAEAMQKISNYKQAAEKIRMIEGIDSEYGPLSRYFFTFVYSTIEKW